MNGTGQQQAALQDPVWTKIQQSLVRVDAVGQAPGLGVLIDDSGLFLAYKGIVVSQPAVGHLSTGESVILNVVTSDDQTQLVLLRAENWVAKGRGGVSVSERPTPRMPILAATANGPIMGEFVSDQRVGQVRPSLRYAPLSEIRLESNIAPVGGAIVFDKSGNLVGILGATLAVTNAKMEAFANPRFGGGAGLGGGGQSQSDAATGGRSPGRSVQGGNGPGQQSGGGGGGDASNQAKSIVTKIASNYGPQGMTVAFSLGPSVIKRVVTGFLGADHKVHHPSIGIFFKTSTEGGALIEEVLAGSPAATAGVKVGDLVLEADGQAVKGPVDLAIALFQHSVGEKIVLKLRRGKEDLIVEVEVGSQLELG